MEFETELKTEYWEFKIGESSYGWFAQAEPKGKAKAAGEKMSTYMLGTKERAIAWLERQKSYVKK